MACSKLEARGHLLHKTGTPPKHFSRECISIHETVEPVVRCRNSKLGTLLPLLMCATLWRAQFSSIFAHFYEEERK